MIELDFIFLRLQKIGVKLSDSKFFLLSPDGHSGHRGVVVYPESCENLSYWPLRLFQQWLNFPYII
jgi:hypothetical protein